MFKVLMISLAMAFSICAKAAEPIPEFQLDTEELSTPPPKNPSTVGIDDGKPQEGPFINEDQEAGGNGKKSNISDDPFADKDASQMVIDEPKPIEEPKSIAQPPTTPQVTGSTPTLQPKKSKVQSNSVLGSEAAVKPLYQRSDKKQYVEHPGAAQGLVRIGKDGTYYYKVRDDNKYSRTGTLKIGSMQPPSVTSADGKATFSSMYGSGSLLQVTFDYEFQPVTRFGKLGFYMGGGIFSAQGSGRFKSTNNPSREKYQLFGLPVRGGATYRLQWGNRQWFAPYITGGGAYYAILETRDDGRSTHFLGAPAAYGGGGVLFNIAALDRETSFVLKNEYGIANLWLAVEANAQKGLRSDFDLSSNVINVGIATDF